MTHSKISTRPSVLANAVRSPFFFFAVVSVIALAVVGFLVATS